MADQATVEREVHFEKRGRVAIITIDRPSKLNALTQDHFFYVAELLHRIAEMDDIVITVLTATGRFFSAGADVGARGKDPSESNSLRQHWNRTFVSYNLHNTHAFYSHPKILITAMNGPAVGIAAAYIAHSDFIYATPHAYLATPFTSLGLVSEGAASRAMVDRLGLSRANELLLMSRKVSAQDMLRLGFVNKIFEQGGGDPNDGKGIDSNKFLKRVLEEVDEMLGEHLVKESLLEIKKQIRAPGMEKMDKAGLDEIWGGLKVWLNGVPQEEFRKIANREKRHKL